MAGEEAAARRQRPFGAGGIAVDEVFVGESRSSGGQGFDPFSVTT